MTVIQRITLREIELPLKAPFVSSSGAITNRRTILVCLESGEEITGWAECVALPDADYLPDTVDTSWLAITEWLAQRLIGSPWEHPREVWRILATSTRGHTMAIASLEMASWELHARQCEVSLSALLGGQRSRIPVGVVIGLQDDPTRMATMAQEHLAAGYRRVKLKVAPGRDVDVVRGVREAVGNDAPLSVDANNAYDASNMDCLTRLDEFDLQMIEQPLAWDDLAQHAALQRRLRTPLCLDESITSVSRVREMIELKSGRVLNLKPGRVGGFTPSLEILELCTAHGVDVWCGGMLESGVGRAHNVALASLDGMTMPGDISPGSRYWERDVVAPAWTMDAEGMMAVPRQAPGMGCEPDMDFIDALTVRCECVSA